MATFKILPLTDNENREGLIPIAIRITHKRIRKYIPTPYSVTTKQLDKDGNVKDISLKPKLNLLWNEVNGVLEDIGFRVNAYSPDELRDFIKKKLTGDIALDFFTFSYGYIESIKDSQPATANNHTIALHNLERYVGADELKLLDITERFLNSYLDWMRKEGGVAQKGKSRPLGERGQSLYLGSIRKLFNEAVKKYNDYDKGDIPIPNRPFDRFKIPQHKPIKTAEDKALSLEQLRAIRDYKPKTQRAELAKDCFMLSFYLCGMNSVDLYSCDLLKNGVITYHRSKTFGRRMDRAEVKVRLEPEAKVLYNRYRGVRSVFKFRELYANRSNFNQAINIGLREIAQEVGVSNLTFYYARHSWASIASNECSIPIETVGMALGHSDGKVVTNIYIKKDWSKVFEANRMVLDLLV